MHLPLTDNQVKLLRRVAESTTVADAAISWLLHLIADPDAVLLSDLGLWREDGETLTLTDAGAEFLRWIDLTR